MRDTSPASAVSAAKYVGGVGGLAVGLWLGAAALGGSAVAWAEDASSGSSSPGPGSQPSSSANDNGSAGSPGGLSSPVSASPGAGVRTGTGSAGLLAGNGSQGSRAGNVSAGSPGSLSSPVSVSTGGEVRTGTGSAGSPGGKGSAAPLAVNDSAGAQNTALILGPSGMPTPTPAYINAVNNLYVQPNSPGAVPVGVTTPEALYPITGNDSEKLNVSVDQGLAILLDAINKQVDAGNTVTDFGWSQSAIIASLAMNYLDPDAPVEFVLVGNEMNPNGGLLSRFSDLTIPSLGIDFYGATPQNNFKLTNYTLEYDGFADFPRYPINFLSVLNAGLGIVFVHTKYASLTPEQIAPVSQGGQAIELPSTLPNQRYFVIPTEDLPLLEPLRLVPLIGNPLADLVQPVTEVIVNLGYGSDPTKGYSTGLANVGTPFGVFPTIDPGVVFTALVQGAVQGVSDFVTSVSAGGTDKGSTSDRINTILASPSPSEFTDLLSPSTDIRILSNVLLQSLSIVKPTIDILAALLITLPAYDSTLFLNGITQATSGDPAGGVFNAFGLPLGATVGLATYSGLIEGLVFRNVIKDIINPPS